MTEHLMVLGTTGSGKTTWCNELHRRWPLHSNVEGRRVPRFSLFVNTKRQRGLWGTPVRRIEPLADALLRGPKLVWNPPRRADGIAWEDADRQLLHLWAEVQRRAEAAAWTDDQEPWLQVVVDEAHKWEGHYTGADGKRHAHPNTLEDMAALGRGLGLRLVYATQHPAGIAPHTRDNLTTRVVFHLGEEGRVVVRSWGWPEPAITRHTSRRYHFATLTRDGWSFHAPRPHRRSAAS